ncbi:uncharacterized protein PFL1_04060 [Pseudozyma flocculosa PF-1]|uniref:EKC/KEOPS complex subunit GON7 n=2 Tax=Pseudozyma flocculosa TaxID=84751 RepID=A0A5C3EU36_9BASI|nr:uncharacterized protein PFL1_04060 [Pseudozyma flocculosa PF-1]EPQ28233.1 hypothetical protein PFL1_04060 [Pseudozyma flocculosa PF-1]SPO35370.1 uncharacterized protein PSFLO_00841 [Pseudozyma flocculosa]
MAIEPTSDPLSITSELHIAIPSPADRPLPASSDNAAQTLSPSTRFETPLKVASSDTSQRAAHMAALADAMDASRSQLNAHLTAWKDWIGKEIDSTSGLKPEGGVAASVRRREGGDDDDDEDEDDEDEEADEDDD